jgi:hypothetical protein
VVADPIDLPLPPKMAAGTYTLRVGLYHPPSTRRLPVIGPDGPPARILWTSAGLR